SPYSLENTRRPYSIPDLNINNFTCFQRLTDRYPEQRICLAQTKKRVGFLTADRRELLVFEFPADVMRSITIIRQINCQLCRNLRHVEVRCAHHSQNRWPNEL